MSASSSPTLVEEKKLVGGICLGSPTTITDLPRAMAPTASLVGICDASSKITRSNLFCDKSKNCATDIGLISIQGQSLGNSVLMLSNKSRREMPLPPLAMFLLRNPIGLLLSMLSVTCGTFAASLA